jgi:hypothetical protein
MSKKSQDYFIINEFKINDNTQTTGECDLILVCAEYLGKMVVY